MRYFVLFVEMGLTTTVNYFLSEEVIYVLHHVCFFAFWSFQGEEARLHCEVRGGDKKIKFINNLQSDHSRKKLDKWISKICSWIIGQMNFRSTTALYSLGEGRAAHKACNSHKFSSGCPCPCPCPCPGVDSQNWISQRKVKYQTFCDLHCVAVFLGQTRQWHCQLAPLVAAH